MMDNLTLLDMMLMHYAAGSLPPQESFTVAMHLALNPEARRKVAGFEALGGSMMEKAEPAEVTENCLSMILARIDCDPCAEKRPEKNIPSLGLPKEIQALIECYCAAGTSGWSPRGKGAETVTLLLCSMPKTRSQLHLMRFAPHYQAPRHSHHGREITVVLDGGYRDETGTYQKGDLVVLNDPGLAHAPQALEKGCLCLVMTEAPLRYTSPGMRFLSLFGRL